jgi:hypothetical protein
MSSRPAADGRGSASPTEAQPRRRRS